MSFENLAASQSPEGASGSAMSPAECEFWYSLIDEEAAGEFVDQSPRTLQAKRQAGGGPKFVRLSKRAVRYRRIDLRSWIETKLVSSTSDPGLEAQPSDDGTEPATALHVQSQRQTGETDDTASQEGAEIPSTPRESKRGRG